MKKILSIKKLTKNKFLNLYKITYLLDGKKYNYFLASRRNINNLECKKQITDAVRAVPYIEKNNKTYVVLIKEFRYAINNCVYGVPAGLVDKGESTQTAICRELNEEIGAKVITLQKILDSAYSSAGLTDETIECFYAKVELCGQQKLDLKEDICYELVEVEKLPQFIKNNKFCLQSALLLKSFYYETMLNKQEAQK